MSDTETWYYVQNGASVGPVSAATMESLVRAGTVAPDTLVWAGSGDWAPASTTSLAYLFAATVPAPPPASRWYFLPKDKRLRIAVLIIIVMLGLRAIVSGIFDIRDARGEIGLNEPAIDVQIALQGCMGTAVDTVQCGFQNIGMVEGKVCMDVIVICSDGRHVAPTCSDRMALGEASTKLVNAFSPGIQSTSPCSTIQYENVRPTT